MQIACDEQHVVVRSSLLLLLRIAASSLCWAYKVVLYRVYLIALSKRNEALLYMRLRRITILTWDLCRYKKHPPACISDARRLESATCRRRK